MKTRKEVIEIAESYIGTKQGSKKHKALVDKFNKAKIKPGKYVEEANYICPWCALFVTVIELMAGLTQKNAPMSYNCGNLIARAKELKLWVEDDAYKPNITDLLIYFWDDTTGSAADCKTGASHVGMINKKPDKSGKFTVVEGNKGTSETCGVRTMYVNGSYIRGYIKLSKLIPISNEEKKQTEEKIETPKTEIKKETQDVGFKKDITYTVTAKEGLNIRSEAKVAKDNIIGAIPNGKKVKAISVKRNWIKIKYGKTTGWICGKEKSILYVK